MDREHFRAHGRRRVDLHARLGELSRAHGEGRDPAFDVRVRDLGLGGACIEVSDSVLRSLAAPFDVDAPVTIEVIAPTLWDPLLLRGKVAWMRRGARAGEARGVRAGVRFEHRDATALYALFQLLGAHAYDAG